MELFFDSQLLLRAVDTLDDLVCVLVDPLRLPQQQLLVGLVRQQGEVVQLQAPPDAQLGREQVDCVVGETEGVKRLLGC